MASPLLAEVLLSVLFALLVCGAVFYRRFFTVLSGAGPDSEQYLNVIINNFFASLDRLPFIGNLAGAFVWSIAGICIYIIIVVSIDMVVSIRNASVDVRLNKDTPVRFVAVGYELRRGFWAIVSLLYIYCYINLIQNLLLRFNDDITDKAWWAIGLGVVVLSLANYLLYSLIRLVIQNPLFVNLKDKPSSASDG